MVVSIVKYRLIYRLSISVLEDKNKINIGYKIYHLLIIFFLLSYLIVLFSLIFYIPIIGELFTGIIFIFGALFVFIGK